jgi:hypothetical protein
MSHSVGRHLLLASLDSFPECDVLGESIMDAKLGAPPAWTYFPVAAALRGEPSKSVVQNVVVAQYLASVARPRAIPEKITRLRCFALGHGYTPIARIAAALGSSLG